MLEDVPAHLENILELIECIKSRDNTTNTQFPFPFSLDVVSLYTSIPVEEAIENIINRISTCTMSLTKEDIKELLIVTLSNMFFTFYSNVFCQIEGLPMGSSVSGILAIVFMDKLERMALLSYQFISLYTRCVDDIHVNAQTINEEHADEIHRNMNQACTSKD